ncbi:MAG TPA: hypothetical protein DD440_01295, partial [Porticoccaceae bacterium]|nr:hypothetical protein [Porticoccaceae bacterium]
FIKKDFAWIMSNQAVSEYRNYHKRQIKNQPSKSERIPTRDCRGGLEPTGNPLLKSLATAGKEDYFINVLQL